MMHAPFQFTPQATDDVDSIPPKTAGTLLASSYL